MPSESEPQASGADAAPSALEAAAAGKPPPSADGAPAATPASPHASAHERNDDLGSAARVPGELEGAPFVPAEARAELLALKSQSAFLCSRLDGDVLPGRASGEGFYARDTRHLSELRVTVGGSSPVLLSSAMESGHHALINATNPWLLDADVAPVPQETLNVRRLVLIDELLYYQLRVRSFHRQRLQTSVALSLAADFADVFEVRRSGRHTRGEVLAARRDRDRVRLAYVGEDGERRETIVAFDPAPDRIVLDGERAGISWEIDLEPSQAVLLEATFEPRFPAVAKPAPRRAGRRSGERADPPRGRSDLLETSARLEDEDAEWRRECARIDTDNELFDRYLGASIRDLHALMMPATGGELPAAGIPWFVAPFGRDSLVTALETLMLNPAIARGTLGVLANMQAKSDEPWRDAEPGKIPHELRVGELARLGHVPHTPYYGTVDATPLFLMLAAHYYGWTRDLDTLVALRPALDRALAWIDTWGDRDGDGFVEYERRSPAGLLNQGWKDSEDAVVHPDGSLAEGPIALVEVQGYVYAAKHQIADVYAALGESERASELQAQAAQLRERFNELFWDDEQAFFVLALDGRGQQVRTITSNPAHCLYCGIVDEERAARVAERLMASDMFSGWGIRTLSSEMGAYNPMSYHNGSVWPHDNAIAAAGLKRYGFHDAAERIAGALFDVAAGARDYRLPELLCGFGRDGSRQLVAYPVACSPQAWAAAAPFMLLQALLGIYPYASESMLLVNQPRLPSWLASLDLRGLRVADSRVGVSFRRTAAGQTAFSLLEQQGDVRVTMAA
jgi:glycogen debranching enzyme